MANSGEGDVLKVKYSICGKDKALDVPCEMEGDMDIYIDSENNAHFECDRGHRNDFKWDADSC